MGERVALIDGTGLIYRAWYAIPRNLKTARGLHTNAVYGFAQMFRKLLAGRTPRYGAVVFDAPGRTFRKEAFPAYKADRPRMSDALVEQLPWIDKLVAAHDYPILRVAGVEADDVIATLTRQATEAGHEVWIVSGDKDFAQLVCPRVRLFDPTAEVLYDAEAVRRKWGVPPERFADWLALVGDKVDGIPGVPGVGPKTASRWLQAHGELDQVLAAPLKGRAADALRSHTEQVRMARELATVRTDVEVGVGLEDLALPEPSPDKLNAIYRELEFFSLLSAEQVEQATRGGGMTSFVVDDPAMVPEALSRECGGEDPVAVVCLAELPSHLTGELVGVALSPREGFALYFPLKGPGRTLGPDGLALLQGWLEDPRRPKVCHETKRELVILARHGVELRGAVFDTALASYLVDPTRDVPHRLEQVARTHLRRALQPLRTIIGRGRQTRRFQDLSVDRAGAWACHNAEAIRALWAPLLRAVREAGQRRNLEEVDLPLADVLARMERQGIRVDPEPLARFEAELEAEREALEAQMAELVGRRFHPGSLPQLGKVLFEALGLPVIKRTKTGYSTDATVLDRLMDRHPVVPLVVRWRTLAKLVNTYTRVLREAIGPDGRVHATFQQTVSVSGRLISTDPDLQRTPVRTEELRRVRRAFLADEGCVLVRADWSQMELRVLAHLSGDARLLEAFTEGADVHAQTAGELFHRPPDQVTPAQREIGKTVNFATLYGQGASALAQQLKIERDEAARYIERFFQVYDGVARWREAVVTEAYTEGYVTTWLGRRRFIPELTSNRFSDRAYGERIAVNTPVQGSAADLCKLAMLEVDRRISERGMGARMVLQVHDELVFDTPFDEVERLSVEVREAMGGVGPLRVPLVVDIGVGPTWADAKG